MYENLTPSERENLEKCALNEAVKHLTSFISLEQARIINEKIENDPDFVVKNYFGMGLDIRTIIRDKYEWDDLALDGEWFSVLRGAVREILEEND